MSGSKIDLTTWDRAPQFHFFRAYERPHFATTVRINVTDLMNARKAKHLSPFRHTMWAIGAAIHAVPALCLRFKGDQVTAFDQIQLSPTIPLENGDFRYTYLNFRADRAKFDRHASEEIDKIRAGAPLNANDGSLQDVAYLSCLPWLDYTSLDNALPGADDCIPRISWGKIVETGNSYDMAMTLQVHHALVDGRQVGAFFEAVQQSIKP